MTTTLSWRSVTMPKPSVAFILLVLSVGIVLVGSAVFLWPWESVTQNGVPPDPW